VTNRVSRRILALFRPFVSPFIRSCPSSDFLLVSSRVGPTHRRAFGIRALENPTSSSEATMLCESRFRPQSQRFRGFPVGAQ